MSEFKIDRPLVLDFLKKNNLSYADVAAAYQMNKQVVYEYLTGAKTTPKANQFVLKLIRDYGIRKDR